MTIADTIIAVEALLRERSPGDLDGLDLAALLGEAPRSTGGAPRRKPPGPRTTPEPPTTTMTLDKDEQPATESPTEKAPAERPPPLPELPLWRTAEPPAVDDEPESGFYATEVTSHRVPPGDGAAMPGARDLLQPGSHPPAAPPIVPHRRARALLTAAVSVTRPSGQLDIQRARQTVERGQPLTSVDRALGRSWARPVVLLIDTSVAMDAYLDDAESVAQAIRRLDSSADIRRFARDPMSTADRLPRAPTVIAFTDLGIGQPLGSPLNRRWGAPNWRAFAGKVAELGGRITTLVPYSQRRIEDQLFMLGLAGPSRRTRSATPVNVLSWHEGSSVRRAHRGLPEAETW